MTREPSAPSLRLRFRAGVIDATIVMVPSLTLGGLAAALPFTSDARETLTGFFAGPHFLRAIQIGSPILTVIDHHRVSPGSRLAGIQRVDARTGGPESLRSAVIRSGLTAVLQIVLHRVNRPQRERLAHRGQEMKARLAALTEEFADDPAARERAGSEIAGQSLRGCVTAMLPSFALSGAQPLTALLSPRRQTVIERLAGVAFVRAPRSR